MLGGLAAAGPSDDDAATLQLAAAVLLIEVMRADRRRDPAEATAVRAALRRQFGLDTAAVEALVDHAGDVADQATGDHRFTSRINRACNADEKAQIIEHMWRIALADGHIDAHENHYLRKIADLLHIPHASYIAAKQRARETAGDV